MGDEVEVDWTKGLSERIRRLIAEGASDDMIDLYIAAKKTGDHDLVDPVIVRNAAREPDPSERDNSILEGALRRIRIAALRAEVNRLDGYLLLRYVLFVMEFSARLVEACANRVNLENPTVTENLADRVRKAALEWLRASPRTPPA